MDRNKQTEPSEKRYFNYELSQLQFFRRVLDLALDRSLPLLERLNYLFITSANLDEYFEIRVAGLKEKIALSRSETGIDGMSTKETLREISHQTHDFVDQIYTLFNDELIPELARQKIVFLKPQQWNTKQRAWIKDFFMNHAMPVMSPIGLDLAHPFPTLVNKSLNYIVSLKGEDAFGRDSGLAIVHAPRTLQRILQVPKELCADQNGDYFIFLNHIIRVYVDELFPGMKATGCYQFRITRNSDIYLNPDDITDLTLALQSELASKRYGSAVRLEIDSHCPDHIVDYLLSIHELDQQDLYRIDGPVNLHRSSMFLDFVQRPDLRFPPFKHQTPALLAGQKDLFAVIRKQDILLHHPYDSFDPVLDFIHQAARDPDVLAIKQTLYRTGVNSPMVKALIEAARNGKEVSIVIELRARFDEAENIALANQLQEAGAVVIYGIIGYKVHTKLSLVIRRESRKLMRYAHLGTGNYHAHTARQYTDFGLFTYNKDITNDVLRAFLQLTGMGQMVKLKKLLASPFTLHKSILHLIENEIKNAQSGKKAFIKAKMNGLSELKIIDALYRASNAGVKITLYVRGVCCLCPGIKNLSSNIKIVSVIGQFLEHERVYCFHNDGGEKIYISSADWMTRNLYYRVEMCVPILDNKIAKRIKKEAFDTHLHPHSRMYQLKKDGSYSDSSSE